MKYLDGLYFRPNNTMNVNGLIKSFIVGYQEVMELYATKTKQAEKYKFTV